MTLAKGTIETTATSMLPDNNHHALGPARNGNAPPVAPGEAFLGDRNGTDSIFRNP
jgi:hypothetical protein